MRKNRLLHPNLAAAGLLSLLTPAGLHGQAGGDDVVKLQAFIVEASREGAWRYAAIPGYEILSRCPDSFTQIYARALARNGAAEAALLPADLWGPISTPVRIILYDRDEKEKAPGPGPIEMTWSKADGREWSSETILHALPIEAGDGETFFVCGNYWKLIHRGAPRPDGEDHIDRQFSLLSDEEMAETHLDLSGTRGFTIDPDSRIRLESRLPELPPWFKAGIGGPAGVFRQYLIREKWNGRTVVVLPAAVWPAQPVRLVALAEFFAENAAAEGRPNWDAEAGLFVRWGLFARNSAGKPFRPSFLDFVRRAANGPVREDGFRGCFGFGYAEAERALAAYFPSAAGEGLTLPLPSLPSARTLIRPATSGEIGRILGDWLCVQGRSLRFFRPELSREYLDQAGRIFDRGYAEGVRSGPFLAAMGLYVADSDGPRARRLLEAAEKMGAVRAKAYLALARLRYEDAMPGAPVGIGDLTPAEYSSIVAPLAISRKQMPSLLESYLLLAEVMKHGPTAPTRGDLAVLKNAIRLFPRHPELVTAVDELEPYTK